MKRQVFNDTKLTFDQAFQTNGSRVIYAKGLVKVEAELDIDTAPLNRWIQNQQDGSVIASFTVELLPIRCLQK